MVNKKEFEKYKLEYFNLLLGYKILFNEINNNARHHNYRDNKNNNKIIGKICDTMIKLNSKLDMLNFEVFDLNVLEIEE